MNQKNFEKVRDLISNRLEISKESIHEDSQMKVDLGMDSLDKFELLYAVEEEFKVTLSDTAFESCLTVKDAIEIMEKELKRCENY